MLPGDEAETVDELAQEQSSQTGDGQAPLPAAVVEAAEMLAELGVKADLPNANRGQPAPAAQLLSTARKLADLPADARYLVLKHWSLPTEGRPSARLLSSFVPSDGPPPEFGTHAYRDLAPGNVLSTAHLLIAAARDAGKLDELAEELDEAALLYGGNAEVLWVLAEIARGSGADVRDAVAYLAARLPEKLAQSNNRGIFSAHRVERLPRRPGLWGRSRSSRSRSQSGTYPGLLPQSQVVEPSRCVRNARDA